MHLIEEFLLGQGTSQLAVMLVVYLPFVESGVALAGQVMDALFEQLIIQVVVLNLLQKHYERLFEFGACFLNVDERLADEKDLVLGDSFFGVILELILSSHLLYLFGTILSLWRLLLDDAVPIEYPALIGQVLSILEIEAFEVRLVDESVDFGEEWNYLWISL